MLHCMFPPAGIFPCVYTDVHTSNVLRTEYVYRWESGKSLRASLARKVVATLLRGRLSTSLSPWKWKYGSPLQCIDNSPPFTAQNLSSSLYSHKFWILTKHVSLAACRNVFLWCQEKACDTHRCSGRPDWHFWQILHKFGFPDPAATNIHCFLVASIWWFPSELFH